MVSLYVDPPNTPRAGTLLFGYNTFDNRYSIEWQAPKVPDELTVLEFITLRDRVFREGNERIGERRACEISFFQLNVERSVTAPAHIKSL